MMSVPQAGEEEVLVQLAVDFLEMDRAEALLSRVRGLIDIVEVGTPVILRDGVGAVRRLHAAFPGLRILADLKIADGGRYEAGLAFEAGAKLVTVLATAADETIAAAVQAAGANAGEVMVDLIGMSEKNGAFRAERSLARRAAEVEGLGVRWVCVHTAVDVQARGGPVTGGALRGLRAVQRALLSAGTAIAGGISPDNAAPLAALAPGIVIAGSSITGAVDPREALIRLRAALGLPTGEAS